jgi:hypothetical protein
LHFWVEFHASFFFGFFLLLPRFGPSTLTASASEEKRESEREEAVRE